MDTAKAEPKYLSPSEVLWEIMNNRPVILLMDEVSLEVTKENLKGSGVLASSLIYGKWLRKPKEPDVSEIMDNLLDTWFIHNQARPMFFVAADVYKAIVDDWGWKSRSIVGGLVVLTYNGFDVYEVPMLPKGMIRLSENGGGAKK